MDNTVNAKGMLEGLAKHDRISHDEAFNTHNIILNHHVYQIEQLQKKLDIVYNILSGYLVGKGEGKDV